MKKLQFKFRGSSSPDARKRLIRSLKKRGATAVRPLFPLEEDEELAALCVVDFEDSTTGRRLLAFLNSSSDVDFAEEGILRKLI